MALFSKVSQRRAIMCVRRHGGTIYGFTIRVISTQYFESFQRDSGGI